jgi:2-amino-4-hydroxy-6-hydroxymethyldihydropteridine diphosphokinase
MVSTSMESKSSFPVGEPGPILLGLGANLPSPKHGSPVETLEAALIALSGRGLSIRAHSRWWESAPVPLSDQPWYVNGVAEVGQAPGPEALLALLHEIEGEFGRVRSTPNAPRVLDLDLLAYGDLLRPGPTPPLLPHPRMAVRGFVLQPLAEIRPGWQHPATGRSVGEMIARLSPDQIVRPLPYSAAST